MEYKTLCSVPGKGWGGRSGLFGLFFPLFFAPPPHTLPSHFDYTRLVDYESNPKHYSVTEDTALGWGRIESHSEFGQANKNVILKPEQQWEKCSQLLKPEWKGQASDLCLSPSRWVGGWAPPESPQGVPDPSPSL